MRVGNLGRTIAIILVGGPLVALVVAWMVAQYNPEWDVFRLNNKAVRSKVTACIENITYESKGRTYNLMIGKHISFHRQPGARNGFVVLIPDYLKEDPVLAPYLPSVQACHPSWKWWHFNTIEEMFRGDHLHK